MNKSFLTGILFAVLWASAATATKLGLEDGQPFIICLMRFFTAGLILLFITHIIKKEALPAKGKWTQLSVYGLLNITLYLGIYVVAMQEVSPGLGAIAIATSPVFTSLLTALVERKNLQSKTVVSLVLCIAGVLCAAWPLLQKSYATPRGLGLVLLSMLIYSLGTIYYSRKDWQGMHILTINGWQTLLGGIFLIPIALYTYQPEQNHFTFQFISSVMWLAIPVSIIAVQLWLFMLGQNAVRATFWLFLAPIAGIVIANIIMKEPVSFLTIVGVGLVIGGLYWLNAPRKEIVKA